MIPPPPIEVYPPNTRLRTRAMTDPRVECLTRFYGLSADGARDLLAELPDATTLTLERLADARAPSQKSSTGEIVRLTLR